jgi:signal transduction histidine kinase
MRSAPDGDQLGNLGCDHRHCVFRCIEAASRSEHGAVFDNLALDDALSSVLDNAQRFMEPGSVIELDLEQTEVVILLKVANVGPRIPTEDLGAIFDYGFSTQLGSEHMGLGLFSARVSVLRMGGTLSAANTADGVVFTISLLRNTPDT